MKELGERWQRIILDVCGAKRPEPLEKILIHQTHLHNDHKVLPSDIVDKTVIFMAPSALINDLKLEYRKAMRVNPEIQIQEYLDVLPPVPHTSFNPRAGKHETVNAYPHFVKSAKGDVLVVPECDYPARIIGEYKPKVAVVMVARRSRRFMIDLMKFEVDYWVDNRIWYWRNREQNVIPKVLFSCLSEDLELFRLRQKDRFVYTNL